jgi:hypothetical protein
MILKENSKAIDYSQQLLRIGRENKVIGAETQALTWLSFASLITGSYDRLDCTETGNLYAKKTSKT